MESDPVSKNNSEEEKLQMEAKNNLDPEMYALLLENLGNIKSQKETISKLLDPVKSDDSAAAWQLRESFIKSLVSIDADIHSLEREVDDAVYDLDTGEFSDDIYRSPKIQKLGLDALNKKILKDEVLAQLALSITGITNEPSLVFREQLFELGVNPVDLVSSFKDVKYLSEHANQLKERYFNIIEKNSQIK